MTRYTLSLTCFILLLAVAASGRLRTASTAFSARLAPLSLAPSQAFWASVPGLIRSWSRCAVVISRERARSASKRAATMSGVSRVTAPPAPFRRRSR